MGERTTTSLPPFTLIIFFLTEHDPKEIIYAHLGAIVVMTKNLHQWPLYLNSLG